MFKKDFHYVILILVIGAALVVGLLFLRSRRILSPYTKELVSNTITIPVSVADTEAERNQGLSGTTSLPENSGKLFVFQTPGTPGFWMKDMNYGLDFVWLNSNLKIVAITPNIPADTYPQIFYPPQQVLYVLEVNSGFSTARHLAIGQQFKLQ
jgi:uncharacterized membrane protein (UPF0127 family)